MPRARPAALFSFTFPFALAFALRRRVPFRFRIVPSGAPRPTGTALLQSSLADLFLPTFLSFGTQGCQSSWPRQGAHNFSNQLFDHVTQHGLKIEPAALEQIPESTFRLLRPRVARFTYPNPSMRIMTPLACYDRGGRPAKAEEHGDMPSRPAPASTTRDSIA